MIARQLAKVSAVPSNRRTGTGRKSGIKEDRKVGRSRAEFQSISPVLPKQLHLRVCRPLLTSIHSRKASIRPQLRRIILITKLVSPSYALLSHHTHHSRRRVKVWSGRKSTQTQTDPAYDDQTSFLAHTTDRTQCIRVVKLWAVLYIRRTSRQATELVHFFTHDR